MTDRLGKAHTAKGAHFRSPGITIFAGRFGSGKTEAAISYAVALVRGAEDDDRGTTSHRRSSLPSAQAQGTPQRSASGTPPALAAVLIDLDIVTPYFRSREAADVLRGQGVEVIAPSAIGRHLDTPAITPEILGAIQQLDRPTVLDVGGDRQGARALGGFSQAIRQRGYTMHFVVNPYRPFTNSLEGLARSIAEIEVGARLQVTSLVSNPNLKGETTVEQILEGNAQIEGFARALSLPIALVCIDRSFADGFGSNHFAQPVLVLDRFLVQPWE
jgi:hypothetical protein